MHEDTVMKIVTNTTVVLSYEEAQALKRLVRDLQFSPEMKRTGACKCFTREMWKTIYDLDHELESIIVNGG